MKPPRKKAKAFGERKCYRIKLNGIEAAVVRPEPSRYPADFIEVIVPGHPLIVYLAEACVKSSQTIIANR